MQLDRTKAAGIHIGLSAVVVVMVCVLMLALWYPPPYFEMEGGATGLLTILAGVDICIGPLLTFIVFVPGKRGLTFDLWCIAILQICALAFGLWTVMLARPLYVVFSVDRFEVVTTVEVSFTDAKPEFSRPSFTGPQLVAAIPPPGGSLAMNTLETGVDVQNFARYYVPYGQKARDAVRRGRPVADLVKKYPKEAGVIAGFLAAHQVTQEQAVVLPLHVRKSWGSMFVRRADGHPLGALWLDPW